MLRWSATRRGHLSLCSRGQFARTYARRSAQGVEELGDGHSLAAHVGLEHAIDDIHDGFSHAQGDSGHDEPAYSERESSETDLKPEDVRPPFTEAFTTIDGDARTHRVRRHGNKPLPLSPVIDPVFVAARNKWKMKKALPPTPEEMTPFQKKLYTNAYGTYTCTITGGNREKIC